jgi:hypothetical protein
LFSFVFWIEKRPALRAQFDQLLTATAVLVGRNMIRIPRAKNRRIEHFQKPCHEPLTASDHVQPTLALMFFQGFL